MKRVLVGRDLAFDLLSRQNNVQVSMRLIELAEKGVLNFFIPSVFIHNLNYLLTKQYNAVESRRMLSDFIMLAKILTVDEKVIDQALSSEFMDFEDAIQYYTAIENKIEVLLSSNLNYFSQAQISIMSADQYINNL